MKTQSEIISLVKKHIVKSTFINYGEFADKAEDLIIDLYGDNKITASECAIMRQDRDWRCENYYCKSLNNWTKELYNEIKKEQR